MARLTLKIGQSISLIPAIETDIRFSSITGLRTLHVGVGGGSEHAATFIINEREGHHGLLLQCGATTLNVSENLSCTFFWPADTSKCLLESVADENPEDQARYYTSYSISDIDVSLDTPDIAVHHLSVYQDTDENVKANIEKSIRTNFLNRYALTSVIRNENQSAWKFDHWKQFRYQDWTQSEFCFRPVFKLDRVQEIGHMRPGVGDVNRIKTGFSENPAADYRFSTQVIYGTGCWDSAANRYMGNDQWEYVSTTRQETFLNDPNWHTTGAIPRVDYYQNSYYAVTRKERTFDGYERGCGAIVHGCSHYIYSNTPWGSAGFIQRPYDGRIVAVGDLVCVQSGIAWNDNRPRVYYLYDWVKTPYTGKAEGSPVEVTGMSTDENLIYHPDYMLTNPHSFSYTNTSSDDPSSVEYKYDLIDDIDRRQYFSMYDQSKVYITGDEAIHLMKGRSVNDAADPLLLQVLGELQKEGKLKFKLECEPGVWYDSEDVDDVILKSGNAIFTRTQSYDRFVDVSCVADYVYFNISAEGVEAGLNPKVDVSYSNYRSLENDKLIKDVNIQHWDNFTKVHYTGGSEIKAVNSSGIETSIYIDKETPFDSGTALLEAFNTYTSHLFNYFASWNDIYQDALVNSSFDGLDNTISIDLTTGECLIYNRWIQSYTLKVWAPGKEAEMLKNGNGAQGTAYWSSGYSGFNFGRGDGTPPVNCFNWYAGHSYVMMYQDVQFYGLYDGKYLQFSGGTYGDPDQNDYSRIQVVCYSANGSALNTGTTGWTNRGGLKWHSVKIYIPAGTEFARFICEGSRAEGNICDSYFCNLSMKITKN